MKTMLLVSAVLLSVCLSVRTADNDTVPLTNKTVAGVDSVGDSTQASTVNQPIAEVEPTQSEPEPSKEATGAPDDGVDVDKDDNITAKDNYTENDSVDDGEDDSVDAGKDDGADEGDVGEDVGDDEADEGEDDGGDEADKGEDDGDDGEDDSEKFQTLSASFLVASVAIVTMATVLSFLPTLI